MQRNTIISFYKVKKNIVNIDISCYINFLSLSCVYIVNHFCCCFSLFHFFCQWFNFFLILWTLMKKLLNFPSFSPFFQKINKSVFCTFDCVKKRGFNVHVKRCSPLSLWKIFKAKKFKKLSRERENFHGGSAASKKIIITHLFIPI